MKKCRFICVFRLVDSYLRSENTTVSAHRETRKQRNAKDTTLLQTSIQHANSEREEMYSLYQQSQDSSV
jgi:hypothetical protein